MEEVQQGSNGTESQTAVIPTTITSSQFSQIAQQVNGAFVCAAVRRETYKHRRTTVSKCHVEKIQIELFL